MTSKFGSKTDSFGSLQKPKTPTGFGVTNTSSPSSSPPKTLFQKSLSGNFFGFNKNKGYMEAKKNMNVLEKKTKFSKETLEKLAVMFYTAYPDGQITRSEFIRENQSQKGGSDELWASVYQLMDANGDGGIDIQEFLLANSIAATGDLDQKVGWMFSLFDEDRSGTLQEIEVKKFIDLLLKTNTNYGENNSFIERIYSVMDEMKTGEVTIEDFIRVAKTNPQLADLVNSYTNIIMYDVDFEKKKSKTVDTKEFDDQVAGHSGGIKSIIKKGKQLWKPLNQTEFEFYEEIKASNIDSLKTLKDFTVGYHGRTFVDYTDREDIGKILHYLIIDDLTFEMKKPCVIDLKMGTREYSDEDSTKKKVQKVVLSHVTASNSLGFRICGIKVWKVKEQAYGKQSKKKALLLSVQQIEESLLAFIDNGKEFRFKIYSQAIIQLTILLEWFEKHNNHYAFYASSILFIYDGDSTDGNLQVKMIDFAHVQKLKVGGRKKHIFGKVEESRDDSYITGLRNLIESLKNICDHKTVYKKHPGGKGLIQMPETDLINKVLQTQLSQIEGIVVKAKEKNDHKTVEKLRKELASKQEEIDELTIELKYYKDVDEDVVGELNVTEKEIKEVSTTNSLQLTKDAMILLLQEEIAELKKNRAEQTEEQVNVDSRALIEKDILIDGLWRRIKRLECDLADQKSILGQKELKFGAVLLLRQELNKIKHHHTQIDDIKQAEIDRRDEIIEKLTRENQELKLQK